MPDPRRNIDGLVGELAVRLGDRLSRSPALLEHHGRGEGHHPPAMPDVVVFPTSTEEVAFIAAACHRRRVPIVPFGAGTSLEGGVAALEGGLCLNLSRMNAIIEVNAADFDCSVQAGVTREALNTHLRDVGLFFPIDPGANATLGGMAATRASGTNAVRYGTMRDNVLAATAVLADGRIIRTGRRARKSAAGYDLTRLLIGSEGTLAVMTELRLRLHGIPEAVEVALCSFESLQSAVDAVIATIQMAIPVARIELLDDAQMRASNRFSRLDELELPTLFFEFHGTSASVAEQAASVQAITATGGGGGFRRAATIEDRARLWRARHNAYHAAKALRPGAHVHVTDVCVPISRLADCIVATRADIDELGLIAPIVGHVGDGNFHVLLVLDPEDAGEAERANQLNQRLVHRALDAEGTSTGEHGIGMGKRDALIDELGEEAVSLMRALKMAIDPAGLMNPGKIFLPPSIG